MMPLKTPKEEDGTPNNRQSVKSDGLVEKTVEGERNQEEDPAPSNSGPSCSRREVSPVSSSSVSDIENGPGSCSKQLVQEELEQIFGLLRFADVKSARLVNKHWRQASTTLLRKSSKMIEMDRGVADCITIMGDGQFPVNRLEVSLFTDEYHNLVGNTEVCLAFPGICAWVKQLTISVHISKLVLDDMATFPTDSVYKDLTDFNLKLIQWTDLFQESWERITDVVRSILENSPYLREVKVEYDFSGVKDAEWLPICPVIENLLPIINSVGTSNLSSINFKKVPLEKIDLAKWATLNLKLKKLGFNVSCFSKSNELLEKFLETQTRTLKDLTLDLCRWDTEAPAATFTFPRLEKLEQLRVICGYKYAPGTFADIDYARMFPCLKKLDLKDDHANWRDFLGNDLLAPTNTVEELIFPWLLRHDGKLTPNPAVTAATVFTGLTKLEIYADPVLVQAVYENVPNLEVLTLYSSFSKSYDNVITGLGLEMCSKVRDVMTRPWVKNKKISAELLNAEGRSMARLLNLKTLKLSPGSFDNRLAISRLSLHVFKKMISLECLDLFDGCAGTAENCSADEDQKQFLEKLRANFVVI